jgi:hypothetical protein
MLRAHEVAKDTENWKLSSAQKRGLYATVAKALDKINDTA